MNPAREAIYLPLLFLTVTLLGGLRIGERVVLVPPPLFTLVFALLLLGVLVKGAALDPERLMSPRRSAMANVNGFVLLVTAFFASAQAFSMVTPDAGLPRLLCGTFLFVLLLNTIAAATDRVRVLRSLLIIFGAAFILKFVILAALANPAGGTVSRVLQILLEGVTLGTLNQPVSDPATGYVAFFVLVLFLFGLAMLPSRRRGREDHQRADALEAKPARQLH
jgi:hypothetical protein